MAVLPAVIAVALAAGLGTAAPVAGAAADGGGEVALAGIAHAQRAVGKDLDLDGGIFADKADLLPAQLPAEHHPGAAHARAQEHAGQTMDGHLGGAVDGDVGGDLPSVIIRNAGQTGGVSINIGNNRYAGINDLKQNVLTLTDDLIIERGAHSLTVGMHHEFYNIHNKYLANAGICSRREADELIQQGLVKVNGTVVTELGTKISHNDVVEYDEKVVALESKCYVLLNKPKDVVTTSDDPNGRKTVMDIVKGACTERIYPVGRLDRNTTGVLLLTNDGDLASKLTHPKYVKKKIYHVWCDKDIAEEDMQRIADGIELEDGPIHADAISYATEKDRNQAGIEIHSGRNRIVRRIFESLGYHVTKLDRVYFAGLTKKNLSRGRWRYLTQEEVNYLKMGSFE